MSDPGTFGKSSLLPFIGLVVEFDNQGKQSRGQGFGWRYKVRIIGDYSKLDTIKEEEIRYAIVMLPTTAGSGGGGRLTTPRIVQGDLVFGYYANNVDGLPIITGVFPRSSEIDLKKDGAKIWDILSGFWKNIQPGILGNQEVNEHDRVSTPTLGDGKSKVDRNSGKNNLAKLGLDPDGDTGINEHPDPSFKLRDGVEFNITNPGTPTNLLKPNESNMDSFIKVLAEQDLVKNLGDATKSISETLNEYREQTGSTVATAEAALKEVRNNKSLNELKIAAAGLKTKLKASRENLISVVDPNVPWEPAPPQFDDDGEETKDYNTWYNEVLSRGSNESITTTFGIPNDQIAGISDGIPYTYEQSLQTLIVRHKWRVEELNAAKAGDLGDYNNIGVIERRVERAGKTITNRITDNGNTLFEPQYIEALSNLSEEDRNYINSI